MSQPGVRADSAAIVPTYTPTHCAVPIIVTVAHHSCILHLEEYLHRHDSLALKASYGVAGTGTPLWTASPLPVKMAAGTGRCCHANWVPARLLAVSGCVWPLLRRRICLLAAGIECCSAACKPVSVCGSRSTILLRTDSRLPFILQLMTLMLLWRRHLAKLRLQTISSFRCMLLSLVRHPIHHPLRCAADRMSMCGERKNSFAHAMMS